jgi:hypothetical protein
MPGPFAPSEAQLESQICDLLAYSRHFTIKTEAGSKYSGASLPVGHPDLLALLPIPGSPYALAVLLEVKTPAGKLSAAQSAYHAHLRACGIEPHVVRSVADIKPITLEGQRLVKLLQEAK